MKYIRTKDGRIIENHHNLQIINNALCNMQNGKVWLVLGEVLKIADTIGELCDEVVIKNPNENPHILYILYGCESEKRFKYVKDRLEHFKECEVYGAIWTDKGLIYVAKMNDKGELELL